jgi:hypothetical protein
MDKIAIELSKLPFIETINALKAEIDGSKPISKEIEDKVFQKLKLDWNYNSNAIMRDILQQIKQTSNQ